ncbi:hypothetical protein [Bauldia sp.]|uniref:hypothetical protein n=1 Tax=Bauldia sp. TaxID=2575872 RepID=UPI003BAC8581
MIRSPATLLVLPPRWAGRYAMRLVSLVAFAICATPAAATERYATRDYCAFLNGGPAVNRDGPDRLTYAIELVQGEVIEADGFYCDGDTCVDPYGALPDWPNPFIVVDRTGTAITILNPTTGNETVLPRCE